MNYENLNLTAVQASMLAKLFDRVLNPFTLPKTADWLRQCWYEPTEQEVFMAAANEILHGHGVEHFMLDLEPGAEMHSGFDYVNVGDSYIPTVMLDIDRSRFFIASIDDVIEQWQARQPDYSLMEECDIEGYLRELYDQDQIGTTSRNLVRSVRELWVKDNPELAYSTALNALSLSQLVEA